MLGGPRAPLPQPVIAPLEPGSLLGEVYRVIRSIGQGAAGAVYEVERSTDHQRLAAKVLSGEADENTLIRFAREAQLLARLSHPNLISIVDVDVSPGGTLFIVMELVKGTSLRNLRHRYGDLAWSLPVLHQIAIALAAVHERGIIHRGEWLRFLRRKKLKNAGRGTHQELNAIAHLTLYAAGCTQSANCPKWTCHLSDVTARRAIPISTKGRHSTMKNCTSGRSNRQVPE
jgi:hypothetical protein